MVRAVLSLLVVFNVISRESQTYILLNFFADAVFYFLPIMVAYNAAKAGVIEFSDALNAELADSGVAVSAILPSFTNTGLISGLETNRYIRVVEPEVWCAVAGAGGVVVSGGAAGIDGAAHEGCLSAGGSSLAVLGTGVDVAYPRSHAKLFERLSRDGGLVSEYPLGSSPRQWRFPERNRIIASLARPLVVVEAPARSGAMITAPWLRNDTVASSRVSRLPSCSAICASTASAKASPSVIRITSRAASAA